MKYIKSIAFAVIIELILYRILNEYGLVNYFTFGGFIFTMLLFNDLMNYGRERTGALNTGWLHRDKLFIKETLNAETEVNVDVKGMRFKTWLLKFKKPSVQIYILFLMINVMGFFIMV